MKANSYSSSEEDGDFNANDSEEDDYDLADEQELINNLENDKKVEIEEKKSSTDEVQQKPEKTIYDLDYESDDEDFQNNKSSSDESTDDIEILKKNETEEKTKEIEANQNSSKPTNSIDLYLSNLKESDSESDDDNFEDNFKNPSNENSEAEYSDIENLKKELKTKENKNPKDSDELKNLFTKIIELIHPYNNALEALNNSINDDEKAQKITDAATQLLFFGKYNIYSCKIDQLKSELNEL